MTKGIHHITAIASDAQKNVDFYTTILGLRLVKKTVNQDDTQTYHLFFGDRFGEPGMDLTFFIFLPTMQGMRGNGLVTKISLAVPQNSLTFWEDRLTNNNVHHHKTIHQFGHDRTVFFDQDNQQLELVGIDEEKIKTDSKNHWTTSEVSDKEAVRHFHSATLSTESVSTIHSVLTSVFGYELIDEDGHVSLYKTTHAESLHRAELLEVSESPDLEPGLGAAGTVHHIAFRAKDEEELLELRQKVLDIGLYPTGVIDRFYFKSVYFRTRAGILFEIATDGPGFTADQQESELGIKLALPPFLADQRATIESKLKAITYDPTL